MYQIRADFEQPHLAPYKALFDQYDVQRRMLLVDITFAIISNNSQAALAEQLSFDEEGYLLNIYANSAEALQHFAAVVCPVYQQREQLEQYIRRVANSQAPTSLPARLQRFMRRIIRV